MRIVSLLPAATDIVAVLGRLPDLVGRTHECDWPAGVASVPVVTTTDIDQNRLSSREISSTVAGAQHRGSGLYHLDADRLAALRPDLVLTQDLCEVCAVSYQRVTDTVRSLEADIRVVSLEPRTLPDVLGCVGTVGELLDVPAEPVLAALRARLAAVTAAVTGRPRRRVAAIEWLDPIWPAGHWVPEQITIAGGVPLLAEPGEHTSPVPWQAVLDARPDVVVLLPCGFPPDRTRAELPALAGLPGWSTIPEIWIVDGPAHHNRPGPRVVDGVEALAHILHGVGPAPANALRVR